MDLTDFEFKKERKLGEFIQDFINLLRIIVGHIGSVMLKLLALPIASMLLVGYYLSTQFNTTLDYSSGEIVDLILAIGSALGFILFVSIFAFGLTIEYFILLREHRDLSFGSKEVWQRFRENFYKYLRFLGAAIIVTIIIIIPMAVIALISIFIPIVGSIMVEILLSIVGLWYFTAFMLYRENYYDLIDVFGTSFRFLKKKIMEYGIASYIVSFLFQSLLTLVSITPTIIIFLIAYNTVGFNNNFFDTYWGKIISSLGGSVMTIFLIVYSMLSVLSYGIIYETAKELNFGESVFQRIAKIGGNNG